MNNAAPSPTPASAADLFKIIEPGTVLPIDCSVSFFYRMQSIVGYLVSSHSKAELVEAQRQIETQTTKAETWEDHYLTGLMFCKAYEDQAKSKNLLRDMTPAERNAFGLEEPTSAPGYQSGQAA